MKSAFLTVTFAASLVVVCASNASAQPCGAGQNPDPSPIFGAKGEWVIMSNTSFGIAGIPGINNSLGFSIQNTSGGGESAISLNIQPAIDYFVVDNLSLGGFVGFAFMHDSAGGWAVAGSIGPRIGYNLPLTSTLSTWPKLGVSYTTGVAAAGGFAAGGSASTIDIYVPLILHSADHFFLGVGPGLSSDLSGDLKRTTFGVQISFGGWFGPARSR